MLTTTFVGAGAATAEQGCDSRKPATQCSGGTQGGPDDWPRSGSRPSASTQHFKLLAESHCRSQWAPRIPWERHQPARHSDTQWTGIAFVARYTTCETTRSLGIHARTEEWSRTVVLYTSRHYSQASQVHISTCIPCTCHAFPDQQRYFARGNGTGRRMVVVMPFIIP